MKESIVRYTNGKRIVKKAIAETEKGEGLPISYKVGESAMFSLHDEKGEYHYTITLSKGMIDRLHKLVNG